MSLFDAVQCLRSKIAMFLHTDAGDPAARNLLYDAAEVLRTVELSLADYRRQLKQAEALLAAEVDDGK